jgi:hypothetical protein
MISADECLKYAAECEEMANKAKAEDREQLLKLAGEWRQMAEIQAGGPETLH